MNPSPQSPELEDHIRKIGEEIHSMMAATSPSILDPSWWSGRVLEWAMNNEWFKVQMFRFIDVLPVLKGRRQVTRFIREYFEETGASLPGSLHWGVRLSSSPLSTILVAPVVKKNLEWMARRFIIGEDPRRAVGVLKKLRKKGLAFTVDLLGEATLSDREADICVERYLEAIRVLSGEVIVWKENPVLDRDHRGEIPRLNLSVKLSSLCPRLSPLYLDESVREVRGKLRPILEAAASVRALVNFDMETYDLKELTYRVFRGILDDHEFSGQLRLGIVVQAYLHDSASDLESLIRWAGESQQEITIRLVKGAYWDYETVIRKQKGWSIPVFLRKEETDRNYERLTRMLLENPETVRPAFATHNIRSIAHAVAVADQLNLPRNAYEIQMLNGMAEPIRDALVKRGFRVRLYTPIGQMLPGMAYLVRRLLENTSNESFLRKNFVEKIPFEKLIAPPVLKEEEEPETPESGFANEPPADFTDAASRERFLDALEKVKNDPGREYPLLIGGSRVRTEKRIVSVNPADPGVQVGIVSSGDRDDADRAVREGRCAWEMWRRVPPGERADYLFRTAEIIHQRRFEFAALQVFEVGKNWREADADVCEAIDFLRYYGGEMIRMGGLRRLSRYPGELNHYHYSPRGVGVVLSPWNFPLAISTGMTSAGIVTGNCVILKPSSLSPVTAAWLIRAFREAGLPDGVLQFLPGPGEEVGRHLVRHEGIDWIAFTGSREVGLDIIRSAAVTRPGQRNVKQVIAEMGGKNAVIIDESADLDEAVRGVLSSAFGFQGQKCSACSRVIVHREIARQFVSRLVEAAKSLRIGPPSEPSNFMGPVVDEQARQKIMEYLEIGSIEGSRVFLGETPSNGFFVPPAIFTGIQREGRLFREEIFGPVLSVIEARDLDEALSLANDSDYALTGGFFSRSPANIDRVRHEFDVGNLYINRGITGALVGRQPFGGARMSGVGSKAGGPDYLRQFMIPRTISENTLRRGFAPVED